MITENIKSIIERIASSCKRSGRPFGDVKLICVTKTAAIEEIEEVLSSGVAVLGENRVRDAVLKHSVIGGRAEWHLIGHLQTNKVKDAVRIFSLIHSVDSARLAAQISKEAARIGKAQDILVQVNTSGEASKFGPSPAAALGLIEEIAVYPNINIKGLMTIASETDNPEDARPHFRALRELRDRINACRNTQCAILSMGMTGDFEVAIEEGSNMVRIGRAIFGG